MAMSIPPRSPETSALLRGFSIWPGVCVGVGVAFGLVGLEVLRPIPHALLRVIGGVMVLAHGVIAFAMVTLLGEALTIAAWDRALGERLDRLAGTRPGPPLLVDSGDPSMLPAKIEEINREFLRRRRETLRMSRVVTYVVPLIGFGVSSWDPGTQKSWPIAAQPLLIGLGEAFMVLLLIVGISNAAEVVVEGWRLLAGMISAGQARDDPFAAMTGDPEPPPL